MSNTVPMSYKALILVGNKNEAQIFKQYLIKSEAPFGEVKIVHDKEAYRNALLSFDMDLIISDYEMTDINGLQAIRLRNTLKDDVPIIIVSASIGEEKAVELIKEGAVDFLERNNAEKRLAKTSLRAIKDSKEKQKIISAKYALQQAMKRYTLLFESSLDGLVIAEPTNKGKIIDANNAFIKLLGYTNQEVRNLKWEDLFAKEPKEFLEFLDIFSVTSKQSYKGKLLLKSNDGNIIPVEIISRLETLDKEHQIYSIIRDIREREKAEAELKRQYQVKVLQQQITETINNNTSFSIALEMCLDKINSFLGWDLGHLYIKDFNEGAKLFVPLNVWHKSNQEKYNAFIEETTTLTFPSGEGFIGKVAKNKKPKWFKSVKENDEYYRTDGIKKSNLKSGLLLPITVNNVTEAVLELYTENECDKNEELQVIIEAATQQMSLLFERKLNMDYLQDEKERYRLLAENSTDMISRHTKDGKYLYASPSLMTLLGYKPEELIGKSAYLFIHPNDLEKIETLHSSILKNPKPYKISYRLKKKNGEWLWVETIGKVILDLETDEINEIQTSTRDISDRITYEQELEATSNLNKKIVDSLPGIFFILNNDGKINRTNARFKSIVDYSIEKESELPFIDFISPEDRKKAQEAFEKAFEEGHVELELSLITKTGEKIPYLMTGIVDILRGDKLLLGTGIDIKERKQIEYELKSEKKFIDRAINSLPGLFYVLDEEQNYVRVNDEFITTLGYSRSELDNMNPLDFYLKEDHEKIIRAIQNAFEEGYASIIAKIRTKDGNLPYFYLTGSHFVQDGKNYILGTGVNITEQIRLERLLDQAHNMARIGAWEVDLVKNEIIWSKITKEIHEVPDDYEPKLETAINFYTETEDRKKIELGLKNAIDNNQPWDVEAQILTAKGNKRWVRAIGKPYFNEGVCIRLYGSFQDITAHKQREEKILEGLREREALLQEIHHRVKNNLALISGMLQLQVFAVDDQKLSMILNDSQSRIKSIALLHEQLYKSESFSKVNFLENLKELVDHVYSSFQINNKIVIELNTEDIYMNINQAVPLTLIINELLTNSLKHAFNIQEKGKIVIDLFKKGEELYLNIKDNGCGLPVDFNLNKTESLGITLIKTLSSQLDAQMNFSSTSNGTTFELNFTIQEQIRGSSGDLE